MAKKIRTSFSLSQETLDDLKSLAIKHNRSKTNMLEYLVKQSAKELPAQLSPSLAAGLIEG
jgi:predicted transcriptional regulator